MGSDAGFEGCAGYGGLISIHAPRMGSDDSVNLPCAPPKEFQSTLPGWGATLRLSFCSTVFCRFQSTLPGWGATRDETVQSEVVHISIHAPRMGSDTADRAPTHRPGNFNPRSPDGERPGISKYLESFVTPFQSTLPGWGATVLLLFGWRLGRISIHAPRMGSDWGFARRPGHGIRFQSTLPGWGATPCAHTAPHSSTYFNPRSPDGERPFWHQMGDRALYISIHAPRMGSDGRKLRLLNMQSEFQSTLPGWGATSGKSWPSVSASSISIHAPRMGSDSQRVIQRTLQLDISIHAPRMGSDHARRRDGRPRTHFNPRSPDGERRHDRLGRRHLAISIHAPRMGSDFRFRSVV